MAILRCTLKLLAELGVGPSEAVDASDSLVSWHANLLRFDRRKSVLFTNDLTLYSIFVPGLRKPQFRSIADVFGQAVFRSLRLAEFTQAQIEAVLDDVHRGAGLRITKTNNRRVLGSMNDLAYQIDWMISSGGGLEQCSIDDINERLNRIPMSVIKPHKYSVDALRDTIEAFAT